MESAWFDEELADSTCGCDFYHEHAGCLLMHALFLYTASHIKIPFIIFPGYFCSCGLPIVSVYVCICACIYSVQAFFCS